MRILGALLSIVSSIVVIVVNLALLGAVLLGIVSVVLAPYDVDLGVDISSPTDLLLVSASVVAALLGLMIVNRLTVAKTGDA